LETTRLLLGRLLLALLLLLDLMFLVPALLLLREGLAPL
jgi:hypothetical protein